MTRCGRSRNRPTKAQRKADVMRKAILGCLTTSLLFLSGCIGMSPDGPASATVNGQTFRTGFYGTLFPYQWETGENVFTVKGTEYHEVLHGTFSLYHADIGPYTSGTIYCREDQYEEACRYYANPEHYSYYCIIGVNSDDTTEQTILIEDVDPARFDALLDFADNAEYLPFDQKNHETVETVELPMPDHKTTQRLIFYKESCDSLFLSSRGHKYYILDGALYFVYQYDHGHGEYEKLIAVPVPEEISDYFVAYMESRMP